MIFLLTALIFFAFWIFSEFKMDRLHRIICVVVMLVSLSFGLKDYHLIIPSYERSFTERSLESIEVLLGKGKTEKVVSALRSFREDTEKTSHYKALMNLTTNLNKPEMTVSNQ